METREVAFLSRVRGGSRLSPDLPLPLIRDVGTLRRAAVSALSP